jgi:hypothetical protein
MTKRYLGVLAALLIVGLLGAFRTVSTAQDTWTGRSQQFTRHFKATTINGGANVVSASTGKKIIIKSIVGATDTTGHYTFYTTVGGAANTPIGSFHVLQALTSTKIFNEADLGRGLQEADSGVAIYCVGPGVLSVVMRTQEQ